MSTPNQTPWTNLSGNWFPSLTFRYNQTLSSGLYECVGGYTDGSGQWNDQNSGVHKITFDPSNGTWADGNANGSDPDYITTTNVFASTTSVTGYPSKIFLWGGTTLNCEFNTESWAANSTGTEGLNSGTVTQNMDGSLSFQVSAGSDSNETYSISLDNVDKASIVPSGVGPWYKNYTYAEHTAIGSGTWRLYDQNGILASIEILASATPPTPPAQSASAQKRVFCNFW